MITHLYWLINPINDKIFYIGQTRQTLEARLEHHIRKAKCYNSAKVHNTIINILEQGYIPIIKPFCIIYEDTLMLNYQYRSNIVNKLELLAMKKCIELDIIIDNEVPNLIDLFFPLFG